MMKGSFQGDDGSKMIVLALSFANMDRLREQALDGFIEIDCGIFGLPGVSIILTAGKDEHAMFEAVQRWITPETKLHISDKLKS